MARRVLALISLGLALIVCMVLAASESLTNRTGRTATAVMITFSEKVRITSYDESVFPNQEPTNRASVFTFSGGALANRDSFKVAWTPAGATLENCEWLSSAALGSIPERTTETVEYALPGGAQSGGGLQGKVTRTIQRGVLPFAVTFAAAIEGLPAGSTLTWDTDIYVDTDGDGNTENDADATGSSLALIYTENYNPIVKIIARRPSGEVASWQNMVRNDFSVGETIALDGDCLLAMRGTVGQGNTAHWTQHHMERMSLEYMTENEAVLSGGDGLSGAAGFTQPGKYVFSLGESASSEATVQAWVIQPVAETKVVGVMMADVWNECHDDSADRNYNCSFIFSDADAQRKLLYLQSVGLKDVMVMNQSALVQTDPLPKIEMNTTGVIGLEDLTTLFLDVTHGHLAWQINFVGSSSSNSPSYFQDFGKRDKGYYAEYFRQFREQMVASAVLAERQGLRSLVIGWQHPYLCWGLCGIEDAGDPTLANFVVGEWVRLFQAVREVFHGQIGCGIPHLCDTTRRVVQQVDFLYDNMNSYADLHSELAGLSAISELRQAYTSLLENRAGKLSRAFGKPVWFAFSPFTYEGVATRIWDPGQEAAGYDSWRDYFALPGNTSEMFSGTTNPNYVPSFLDQVKYIEALLPVLASSDFVNAIFSHYEHWRLVSYADFVPRTDFDYFNGLLWGSLQGKPAFSAYRLWASMLAPNEELLYRHVPDPTTDSLSSLMLGTHYEGPVLASSSEFDSRGATVTAEQSLAPDGQSLQFDISYTPTVADDWAAASASVIFFGMPQFSPEQARVVSFDYSIDNPLVEVGLTFFFQDGNTCSYEFSRHGGLEADGQWHRVSLPSSEFGCDRSIVGFDLAHARNLHIWLGATGQVGHTTHLRIRDIRFSA